MSQLPFGMGQLDWSNWVKGLIAGFIGSAAGAGNTGIGLMLADAQHFNPQTVAFWKALIITSVVAGITTGLAYLAKNPVPIERTIESTVETTTVRGKPTEVVTTVKETSTQPIDISKG